MRRKIRSVNESHSKNQPFPRTNFVVKKFKRVWMTACRNALGVLGESNRRGGRKGWRETPKEKGGHRKRRGQRALAKRGLLVRGP